MTIRRNQATRLDTVSPPCYNVIANKQTSGRFAFLGYHCHNGLIVGTAPFLYRRHASRCLLAQVASVQGGRCAMVDEVWKDISEFPNYQVSNRGRVRSFHRGKEWRILKTQVQRKSRRYMVASIGLWQRGKYYRKLIHRLVLEAFVGPCSEGQMCCHNNGDSLDNRLSNLRWDTRQANTQDSIRHGSYKGEISSRSIVTGNQVTEMRHLYKGGAPVKELAEKYGLSKSGIEKIIYRKNWRHVP